MFFTVAIDITSELTGKLRSRPSAVLWSLSYTSDLQNISHYLRWNTLLPKKHPPLRVK